MKFESPRSVRLWFVVFALSWSNCGGEPTPVGYWEGKGTARETLMQDPVRELNRSADYEFWFNVAEDGTVTGEIELMYDAVLTVDNLPSVSASPVGFSPNVGGKLTDRKPKRTFPLVGYYDGQALKLALGVPEEKRGTLEFTIRADPGVSAGIGPITVDGAASGAQSQIVKKIPMMPFSPFYGDPKVEKRPGGPYVAEYEQRTDKMVIDWSAKQVGGEVRKAEITPEMQRILETLR